MKMDEAAEKYPRLFVKPEKLPIPAKGKSLVGRLIVVGDSRAGGPTQLDLEVEGPAGVTHERVSGFSDAQPAFAVLQGVNAGSLLRVGFVEKGVFKNLDLAQATPIEVLEAAVPACSPDYRVFGGKPLNKDSVDKVDRMVWLDCLKAAAGCVPESAPASVVAGVADRFVAEFDKRFGGGEK